MTEALFVGAGVALVTPFSPDGINEAALRDLVDFHLREGTDALIVNGSTGEASAMTPREQQRAAEIVIEQSGGRVPVIVGMGGSDTAVVVELGKAARAAGADGILVSAPSYNKPPQRGIVAHYRAVLDAADLPLIIYNVPGRTACNILPATVEVLASDPRVVGVKEACGDISQVAELARRVGDRIAIYSGNDEQVVAMMALGALGVISVVANLAPADISRMVRSFLDGDVAEARRQQLRYLPLISALFRDPNPIPVKAGLRAMGFEVGDVRLPLVPISDEVRRELYARMREVGLPIREVQLA